MFIGWAQEKTVLFRTEKRRNAEGVAYPWIVKTTSVVNHFYIYAVDDDFGPFFLKLLCGSPWSTDKAIDEMTEWAKPAAGLRRAGWTAGRSQCSTYDPRIHSHTPCRRPGLARRK
ncbi:MAG: hypothetical protein ACRDRH_27495 [Pseudonocardia sp.]